MSRAYGQSEPSELSAETAPFVGRELEFAQLTGLLSRANLVTVTGAGGVGKTRLALRAAERVTSRFTDGVCVVELSSLSDPELLPHTVAARLGLAAQDTTPAMDLLVGYLRDRETLLVLDTCEHLIDACAELAERLLDASDRTTLLATSRQPLDVNGESLCPLSPLPVPSAGDTLSPGDAADLFVQRAAAADRRFIVTAESRGDVLTICECLDGIPLALELAASRLRTLPLSQLARLLAARIPALGAGRHGADARTLPAAGKPSDGISLARLGDADEQPPDRLSVAADPSRSQARHRTLHAAIDWSYDLCTPAEQALWERLSVFAGSFGIDAARDVCAGRGLPAGSVPGTLISLVDKSVLVRDEEAGNRRSRYRFLDTIREFGAQRLAASGAETAVRDRLLARYLAKARYFEDHFLDDDQLERLRELDGEHASLRAALEYALDSEQPDRLRDGAELATALYGYWTIGRLREGGYWLGKVTEKFPGDTPERARALVAWSYLTAFQGDTAKSVADGREGIELARKLGDELLAARGYLYLNLAYTVGGRLAEAAESGAEAYRLLEPLRDRIGLLTLDAQMAHMYQLGGDLQKAAEYSQKCLDRFGESSEQWMHSHLHLIMGFALFQVPGMEAECAAALGRAASMKHEIDDLLAFAYALEVLAGLALRAGRLRRAALLMGAAEPLWARTGQRLASIPDLEQVHQLAVKTGREELGEQDFAALYARGSRYPREGIVRLAVSDADDVPPDAPLAR